MSRYGPDEAVSSLAGHTRMDANKCSGRTAEGNRGLFVSSLWRISNESPFIFHPPRFVPFSYESEEPLP